MSAKRLVEKLRESADTAPVLSAVHRRAMREAAEEISRLHALCVSVHDRLLRGDDELTLLKMLEDGWCEPQFRAESEAVMGREKG